MQSCTEKSALSKYLRFLQIKEQKNKRQHHPILRSWAKNYKLHLLQKRENSSSKSIMCVRTIYPIKSWTWMKWEGQIFIPKTAYNQKIAPNSTVNSTADKAILSFFSLIHSQTGSKSTTAQRKMFPLPLFWFFSLIFTAFFWLLCIPYLIIQHLPYTVL